jgi:hypothetical protein
MRLRIAARASTLARGIAVEMEAHQAPPTSASLRTSPTWPTRTPAIRTGEPGFTLTAEAKTAVVRRPVPKSGRPPKARVKATNKPRQMRAPMA